MNAPQAATQPPCQTSTHLTNCGFIQQDITNIVYQGMTMLHLHVAQTHLEDSHGKPMLWLWCLKICNFLMCQNTLTTLQTREAVIHSQSPKKSSRKWSITWAPNVTSYFISKLLTFCLQVGCTDSASSYFMIWAVHDIGKKLPALFCS